MQLKVGAARRLEAIRAAEPFAVVVEEACEVMEPTLISVLAVKSLRKLELIGDHRQLPAFVQNCWFNLETTLPSIKISLFERLIGKGSNFPFTILDEQRRMRAYIADFTRPDYADVVKISDHPLTAVQRVGDVALRTGDRTVQKERDLWGNPQSIPGMQACVYFWNVNGKDGRPKEGGLSACNVMEATAVAGRVH